MQCGKFKTLCMNLILLRFPTNFIIKFFCATIFYFAVLGYSVPTTLMYVYFRIVTLYPGDLILTGTPSGVGYTRNPPEFLKPGDVVESEIEGIGKLRNVCV